MRLVNCSWFLKRYSCTDQHNHDPVASVCRTSKISALP